MTTETTPRHALPTIAAGQAQKELTHNEALAAIDLLLHPAVEAAAVDAPPPAPRPGQCWIVGPAPVGDWAGRAHALAGWTGGGWRFVAAREGLRAWMGAGPGFVQFTDGAWRTGEVRGTALLLGGQQVVGGREPAIAAPAGGTAPDAEARAAIGAILDTLRRHGLIAR